MFNPLNNLVTCANPKHSEIEKRLARAIDLYLEFELKFWIPMEECMQKFPQLGSKLGELFQMCVDTQRTKDVFDSKYGTCMERK